MLVRLEVRGDGLGNVITVVPAHDHVHIVASRIDVAGQVWLGQWEARTAIEATQLLETRYALTPTPGLVAGRAAKKALTKGEIERSLQTEQEPPRQRLQRLVEAAAQGAPTVVQFAEALRLAGVNVRPNVASTGKLNGFSFELDGVPFKGSDLGDAFKWKGLQAQGVTYEQDRDRAGLERVAALLHRGCGKGGQHI